MQLRHVVGLIALLVLPTDLAAQSCPGMSANDIAITFSGATSGCSQNLNSLPCIAGELVTLNVVAQAPYDFACAPHTFNWSFGGTTRTVTHAFSNAALVSVTINNGSQTYVGYATVPITPCQRMNASDVFISYSGATSGCTQNPSSVPCIAGEPVTLTVSASPPYDFSCDRHTFLWSLGGTSQTITHAFSGTTGVSVTVDNSWQTLVATTTVPIGAAQQPGTCQTMTPSNVFITFSGAASKCSNQPNSGLCWVGEQLTLAVEANGYDFSCAPHTFSWNIGGASRTISHTISQTNTDVQATISNGSQVFTITSVVLAGYSCGSQYPYLAVNFKGDQSGCSESGGMCRPGETISFAAVPVWNPSATCYATLSWDFGDHSFALGTGTSVTHQYSTPGAFKVDLTMASGGGGPWPGAIPAGSGMVIVAGGGPPSWGPIRISPDALLSGGVGQPYIQAVSASGGVAPYVFSILDGSLPPGLSMHSDTISGTPEAAGTFTFSVKAEDSRGEAGTSPMSITIVSGTARHRPARP